MDKFFVMYNPPCAGVMMRSTPEPVWVVEPEWNAMQAERMAKALNENPDIPVDELYRLAEAA